MKKFLLILILLFAISNAKERLVVLDPASVETLFMLGAGEQIVGIANLQHSNIYPSDKSSKLTSVGTFSNPSLEKIISLKPSLVILSSYSLNLEEGLKNFGVKSLYLKANHFDDIKKNIQILAQITHKNEEGKRLITEFEKGLESLKNEPLNQSAIYLYSNNPLMAFNDNSLMAEILTLIGIKNLSPKSQIERPIISAEFILKQNPDLLILGINANEDFLTQNALLSQTKALKTGQIYTNEKTHILLRLSPKVIERIAEFKRALKSLKDS
ncbi:ABC transporter substrate-binding protein [Campylobacter upsaliensis]|uniref:ABC transporter substrate-binding protein n=1 Tax=Campylobacter upsaliensis TaxID=28080 RepID=UPI0022EAEC66|nr:ABC transporter substrate-binding protein [Campylobacter upsaliensis]